MDKEEVKKVNLTHEETQAPSTNYTTIAKGDIQTLELLILKFRDNHLKIQTCKI